MSTNMRRNLKHNNITYSSNISVAHITLNFHILKSIRLKVGI